MKNTRWMTLGVVALAASLTVVGCTKKEEPVEQPAAEAPAAEAPAPAPAPETGATAATATTAAPATGAAQ